MFAAKNTSSIHATIYRKKMKLLGGIPWGLIPRGIEIPG